MTYVLRLSDLEGWSTASFHLHTSESVPDSAEVYPNKALQVTAMSTRSLAGAGGLYIHVWDSSMPESKFNTLLEIHYKIN